VDIVHKFKPALTEEKLLVLSKWGVVVLGIIALAVALSLKGIISSLMFAYTIFTAGLIPIVIAGFYKEKLKVTSAGAIAAIIGGGATGLISKINNIKYLDLGALVISVALLFAVSGIERYMRSRQAKGK
jgi:SSS family solute:Na+ symporter